MYSRRISENKAFHASDASLTILIQTKLNKVCSIHTVTKCTATVALKPTNGKPNLTQFFTRNIYFERFNVFTRMSLSLKELKALSPDSLTKKLVQLKRPRLQSIAKQCNVKARNK